MATPSASSGSDQYDSGINPGNHGVSFEKELAFATFVAASLAECRFKLAAEMKAAEKFDDVVLFNEASKDVWLFQAKHSKDGGQILFDDLISTDPKKSNFAFCKYLQSYLKIRENTAFKDYKPTVFMFTNNSLHESEELTKWLNIRMQNVDSMIRWCDPEKYVCFEPLNDEAISNITRIMNSELLAMKEDIEKLSKTGKASDLLVQYKAPLQNITQISNGIISFKEPTVNSIDFETHQWLLSEFKVKPNEGLCVEKLDDRTLRNLNSFFTGNSRNKQPSVPRVVTVEDTREFFKNLIFCVEQPTDLRSVAEELTSCWMRRSVESDDLGQFGKDLAKLFQRNFDEVFDEWHRKTESPKEFLRFENEGSAIVKRMKTELKRKLFRKSCLISTNMSMYVTRTVIVTKVEDDDLKSLQVRDKDFVEQLTKVTAETKCQVMIAEPGMGKTTWMSYIFSQLEQLENLDVYLIRLKNLKIRQEIKLDLLQIYDHELSQESRNVLRKDLENSESRILFLLDGFDEMNPSYHGSVVAAVQELLTKGNAQFVITGRHHVRKLLEDQLKVVALNLKPFDRNEQVKFLEAFWKIHKRDEATFEQFADQLLEKFHSEIKVYDYYFTGIPLMIRMLAEVFADDFQQFLKVSATDQTCRFDFPEQLNVLSLYEKFVKISFNMNLKKRENTILDAYDEIKEEIEEEMEASFDVFITQLQLLAIRYLEIEELQYVIRKRKYATILQQIEQRVQKGVEKSMLISASHANRIDFIHLSYAEYFVAKFVFDNIDEYGDSLMAIIKNREVVRKFFFLMVDNMYNENSYQLELLQSLYGEDSVVVVWACLSGDEKIVRKLLRKTGIKSDDPNHQILLHAAAEGGSTSTVLALLDEFRIDVNSKSANDFTGTLLDFIIRGDFAIHVAARKNRLDIVEMLINKGAEVNVENCFKTTPLHFAATYGYSELVALLIKGDANVHATTVEKWTPLHTASKNGHHEVVKLLIESNAHVDVRTNDDRTPLNLAAFAGHLQVVKMLIKHNANVDTQELNGKWTPLHLAAGYDHQQVVKLLLASNATVDIENDNRHTPLHFAAQEGHIEVVKLLINSNANVNATDYRDWTPLHLAAGHGNHEVVKFLIDSKSNIDTKNNEGDTPLIFAAQNGYLEAAKLLIDANADVNNTENRGWGPLHKAIRYRHLEMVKLLLDSEANIDIPLSDGSTPLHVAAGYSRHEIVKLLIHRKAIVDTKNIEGRTALHYSAEDGHLEGVKLLIDNNANVDTKNNTGWTPLHLAAGKNHSEVVKLLLETNANVDTENNEGQTPLHLAAQNGYLEVVKLLIDNKANVDSKENNGRTPLHCASGKNHSEICQFLIDHASNVDTPASDGTTPLCVAALNGHVDTAALLISHGAEVNKPDHDGTTPLLQAAKQKHVPMARLLLRNGADIYAENRKGMTALEFSLENQHREMANLILGYLEILDRTANS